MIYLSPRFVKKVRHRIPWISHIINEDNAGELNPYIGKMSGVNKTNICVICRGSKNLCRKKVCPVLEKQYVIYRVKKKLDRKIEGSSPPEIFVGRIGYPNVYVGPLFYSERKDITHFSIAEYWDFATISEFLNMRLSLIRGMSKINIKRPNQNKKLHQRLIDTVLSKRALDSEAEFRKLIDKPTIGAYIQPIGIRGIIGDFEVYPKGSLRALEKVYYDEDLKANEAIIELYRNKVYVSRIIQGLSAGMYGLEHQRRLVPTRWSITAIDCIISKWLRDEIIKYKPTINNNLVFEYNGMGDKFIVILFPGSWKYEFIEIWWPGSSWNYFGNYIAICGDYELHWGRTTYASIGGCYYATRLAVSEYLSKIGIKAGVIVIREAYPEHYMPVGVWYVRESVRRALLGKPYEFADFDDAIKFALSRLKVRPVEVLKVMRLIKDVKQQKSILEYINKNG